LGEFFKNILNRLQKSVKKKIYAISKKKVEREQERERVFYDHLVRFVVVYGTGYGEKIE
jgi:hypothetical protein